MKNICLFFLFFYVKTSIAQTFLQGGVYLGGINYAGDLAPSSFIVSFTETQLDYGVFLRAQPTNWLGVKLNFHHGNLSGSDALSNDEGRRLRNLHFRSPLDELSLSTMFFLPNNMQNKGAIRPFIALGIGIFHFNPQAELNGVWYNLQPLSTEGQELSRFPNRKAYALTQVCFPIGLGLQWAISKRMQLEIDVSMRKTLTDYLDDVSTTYVPLEWLREERGDVAVALSNRLQSKDFNEKSLNQGVRGEPKYNDWYMIASLGLTINLLGYDPRHNLYARKTDYLNCRRLFWKRKKR
jgi:hypothetical protein